MACIFNSVLLDLTAGITDSFEGRGLIGGLTVFLEIPELFPRARASGVLDQAGRRFAKGFGSGLQVHR